MTAGGYTIHDHGHRFAAWAAGRAASTRNVPFSVENGRALLEAAGFTADFASPDCLPEPAKIDIEHRRWRASMTNRSTKLTDGIAAKLINVYLKARFVCGGHADHTAGRSASSSDRSGVAGELRATELCRKR